MQSVDALVLAAGRGTRLAATTPKQFLAVGGQSVLARAAAAFGGHPRVRRTVLVVGSGDDEALAAALPDAPFERVVGGASRQASVANGLAKLADDPPTHVLVHDAARPFVSAALIDRVIDALGSADAVIPVSAVADTLKRVTAGVVTGTVERSGLAHAQTPQGFAFAVLAAAHERGGEAVTDDAALVEAAGGRVATVAGERANFKITTADDLAFARRLAGGWPAVGNGFDVHRIVPGGPLILGGLTLDVPFRLDGHSDADVALHAITDALYGAVGEGDIGHHFPPSDPAHRGAPSDAFLRHAAERARAAGTIAHIDLTIVCERPKIGPVREAMRARIAAILDVALARVSVKATTTERLGFTGRGEGIAAQATATVLRAD